MSSPQPTFGIKKLTNYGKKTWRGGNHSVQYAMGNTAWTTQESWKRLYRVSD